MQAQLEAAGVEISDSSRQGRQTPSSSDQRAGVLILPADLPLDDQVEAVRDASSDGDRRLVVITVGHPNPEPWSYLAAGASEVLPWADDGSTVGAVRARLERWCIVDRLARSDAVTSFLVGASKPWLRAMRWAIEAAYFSDAAVLVTGETGTGKELVARLIHALDQRPAKRQLVVVDCATITPTLSGSELFGHERGSFTGAQTNRVGAVEQANEGTLFLDEVGELPLAMQPELLRVLQEGAYKPLGASTWKRTTFRLVSATNQNLAELARTGMFRGDLLHRLAAVTIELPPLEQRSEDIPLLARHFLACHFDKAPELGPSVEEFLRSRRYPGNVRELRHLIARIALRHVGHGPITPGDVPEDERPGGSAATPPCAAALAGARPGPGHGDETDHVDELPVAGGADEWLRRSVQAALAEGVTLRALKSTVARLATETAIEAAGGNLSRAARSLGVTARALQLRRADEGPGFGERALA